MSNISTNDQILVLRNELKNLRTQISSLKHQHKKDVAKLSSLVCASQKSNSEPLKMDPDRTFDWSKMKPIGRIKSVFKSKNGTPRQAGVVPTAHASLSLESCLFTNPEHSLEGLEQFSHVWIIFIFHENKNKYTKAKVQPPRLNGAKMGLFATRCPYRPNPIGLSLIKLESIEGRTLLLSGVDLIDGTPVLDIKPYIPQYDAPVVKPVTSEHVNTTSYRNIDSASEIVSSENEYADAPDVIDSTREGAELDSQDSCAEHKQRNDNSVRTRPSQGTDEEPSAKNSFLKSILTTSGKITHSSIKSEENLRSVVSYTHDNVMGNDNDMHCDYRANGGEINGILETEQPKQINKLNVNLDLVTVTRDGNLQNVDIAQWVKTPPIEKIKVRYTNAAENDVSILQTQLKTQVTKLEHLSSAAELKDAITNILQNDPRSTYRRTKCADRLYYFTIDIVHVTCWFDEERHVAEVLKIKW